MFYAHFVLSKKGPLARIWLAAHWDKKLTKAHVFETNIEGSVEAIIQPKVKLALRTSGHLLLGVVRIYSRKAKYLLADCNEAFVKIKMAFRPGVVDLPEENREAALASINIPETFHDFPDTTMNDFHDLDVQNKFTINQSRPEDITIREDVGSLSLVRDDDFGDMGFDAGTTMMADAAMDDTLYVNSTSNLLLDDAGDKSAMDKPMDIDFQPPPQEEGLGDGVADFGIFTYRPEEPAGVEHDDDSDGADFGGDVDHDLFGDNFVGAEGGLFDDPPLPEVPLQPEGDQPKDPIGLSLFDTEKPKTPAPEAEITHIPEQTTAIPDQTTLISNTAEAFALEPIDVTAIGTERKSKRKRKLIIDEQKGIPSETMKLQLSDTSDITTTLDLAPPTKKLKYWKETGGVEKLFALPGRPIVSRNVIKLFNKNLTTQPMLDGAMEEDLLQLEQREAEAREAELREAELREAELREAEQREAELREAEQRELERQEAEMHATHMEEPPEREMARAPEESLLDEPAPMDEMPSLLEPGRPSLAEASLMSAHADESNLVPPSATPLTRSRVQAPEPELEPLPPPPADSDDDDNYDAGIEDDDDDDAVFNDLPDPSSPSDQEEGADGEDQEEKRWSRRTQQMMYVLGKHLQKESAASFRDMTRRNNRKQVASKFYTLLVLKKMQAIEVEQSSPFGDIAIVHGPKFEAVC